VVLINGPARSGGADVTPVDELLDMIDRARARLMAHAGWHSGPARIYDLLQRATRLRQMEIDNLHAQLPPWETVLGLLIAWHHEAPMLTGPMADHDAFEIVLAATSAPRRGRGAVPTSVSPAS
jgi:hypothetical protein